VDATLIDHVTLNQPLFIKVYKYWLESSTIKVFIDDSVHPFLFDIVKNENLDIYFNWLSIEETIKVRKELIDKIIPLPHPFYPSIKIKEREKIYSVSFISRLSPPSIIRVLGNYDSFNSRTSIAKIVSKIPISFVYLSYSVAKIFIGY
jgi:hypothetical protein